MMMMELGDASRDSAAVQVSYSESTTSSVISSSVPQDAVITTVSESAGLCGSGLPLNCSEHNDFDVFCRFAFPDTQPPVDTCSSSSRTSDAFYFESDHLALKGNEDYRRLLRTFVLLQSQRSAALHDLDTLLQLQNDALRDPLQFASRLQRGVDLDLLPTARQIAELPTIAWERYTDDVESVLASLTGGSTGQSTRRRQKRHLLSGIRRDSEVSPLATSTSTYSTHTPVAVATSSPAVSSQVSEQRRPATFNQPWSVEEQRLLEQLLVKYPPERFEARRFGKIAAELPGRTTQQVTSRVQKYFIKLAKAGLPVPGRMPNLASYGGRWLAGRLHGHHQSRRSHFYYPQSTFLTSVAPPVYMSDDDDDDDDDDDAGGGYDSQSGARLLAGVDDESDDDDDGEVPDYLRDSAEYQELMTLTALRQSLQQRPAASAGHITASVTPHSCELTSKTRDHSTGLSASQFDLDYTSESTGVSSYLDPNYMPAGRLTRPP